MTRSLVDYVFFVLKSYGNFVVAQELIGFDK